MATEIHNRYVERLEKANYFFEELSDKCDGKGSAIIVNSGDNCIRFINN